MKRPLWELLGYCSQDDYEKSGQKMEDEYNKQEEPVEVDPRQIDLIADPLDGLKAELALDTKMDAHEKTVDAINDALDVDPSNLKVTVGGHEITGFADGRVVGSLGGKGSAHEVAELESKHARSHEIRVVYIALPRIWMGPHSDYVKHWHWSPATEARPGVWRLLREASLVEGDIFVRGDAEKPDSPEGMVALSTCKKIDWEAVERW